MLFSVVMPVYNGGPLLVQALEALEGSPFRDRELLVVDDGSVDDSVAIARRFAARVLETGGRRGPAAARNLGAGAAVGEYLFFLDADCAIHPDALGLAARHLDRAPILDALFGSYDDQPAGEGLVSQFKNLQHHFVHQNGDEEAETFWSGCGAIRRSTFLELGGFDELRYRRPSVEDIELGYRLRSSGGRIRLAKDVQVKHLKRWSLGEFLKSELFDRGLPWAELLFERERTDSRELNLSLRSRLSVAATGLATVLLALSALRPALAVGAAVAGLLLLALNWDFYRFLAGKRGSWFAVRSIPLHALHHGLAGAAYLSSGCAAGWRRLAARLRKSSASSGRGEESEKP